MGSFGAWQVQGQQTGIATGGQQSLGPFSEPFSGATLVTVTEIFSGDNGFFVPHSSASFPAGPDANGVWLFPSGILGTIILKGATGDTGIFLNPAGPFFWNFDPANYTTYDSNNNGYIITASMTGGSITAEYT